MIKYIVKTKDSSSVVGDFNSKDEANEFILKTLHPEDGVRVKYVNYTVFDFDIEERDVAEINSHEEAVDALMKSRGYSTEEILVAKNHKDFLLAFDRLLTIAEAWNIEYGFKPNPNDINQRKWFVGPHAILCKEKKGDAEFFPITWKVEYFDFYHIATLDSIFSFATSEQAKLFYEKFASMFDKLLELKTRNVQAFTV